MVVIRETPPNAGTGSNSCGDVRNAAATIHANVWPACPAHAWCVTVQAQSPAATRLVFSAGASTEANYGILRTFAAANGDLLMSKSIGLPTHSGGAPFSNANSQQYKDLASLLPKLKESCSSEVIATGEFWQKFSLQTTRRCCRRQPTSSRTQSNPNGKGSSHRLVARQCFAKRSWATWITDRCLMPSCKRAVSSSFCRLASLPSETTEA